MQIATRAVGDVQILDCSGQITLGEGTRTVRDAVVNLLEKGNKKIVLNLAGVSYIDSAGVGELVSTYASVSNRGGQLKLLHLTKRIRELLTLTKLLTVFQVFEEEKDAVASFK